MTVLLVDDSTTILVSLSRILERSGHQYRTAGSGEEALRLIDAGLEADLVLTDLKMPGMNGIELISELRRRPAFENVPMLVLTTESQRAKRRLARDAGATGWLVKPVKPAALLHVLDQVMTRA